VENWNVVEILKLGLPGLVFLLSVLSYRLLATEQAKKLPSTHILGSIKNFMYINVLLAVLTLASPIVEHTFFTKARVFDIEAKAGGIGILPGEAAVCHNAKYASRYLLIKDSATDKLVQVFAGSLIPCNKNKHIGLNDTDLLNLGWTDINESRLVEVVAALPGYKFEI
jgi:hypothetical protein